MIRRSRSPPPGAMRQSVFPSFNESPPVFGKKNPTAIRLTNFATLIAQDVQITGNVEFSEGLRLDGHVQGNVSNKAGTQTLLVLSDRGSIMGNVRGYDVIVDGTIVGDLTAEHFVELRANAHVTGNIHYQQLRMDCGSTIDGKLTKTEIAQAPSTTAPEVLEPSTGRAEARKMPMADSPAADCGQLKSAMARDL